MRSGSVNAFQTRSRGASNVREMTNGSIVEPAVGSLLTSATLPLLCLQFVKVLAQPIQTFVPEAAIAFEPVVDVLQCACLDAARPPLRRAPAHDQAGPFQHLEV